MGHIEKTAKILRKKLKNNIEIIQLENYIRELGYDVVYYNTKSGDETLFAYDLYEKSRMVRSFTNVNGAKIVFVDGNEHTHDKLILLLHELGHILLKHLGDGNIARRDKYYIDLEAETFAYLVLNPPKRRYALCICTYLCSAIILFGSGFLAQSHITPKTNADNTPNAENDKYVYITQSGTAYHDASCRYVKDKKHAVIPLKEAKKIFTPCKSCNP